MLKNALVLIFVAVYSSMLLSMDTPGDGYNSRMTSLLQTKIGEANTIHAADYGYVFILPAFMKALRRGADPNTTADGNTALHIAVHFDYKELAQLYIDKGGNVDVINGDGVTPLQLCVMFNCYDIFHILLAAGADPNYLTPEMLQLRVAGHNKRGPWKYVSSTILVAPKILAEDLAPVERRKAMSKKNKHITKLIRNSPVIDSLDELYAYLCDLHRNGYLPRVLNEKDEDEMLPIEVAMMNHNIGATKLLLDFGVDVIYDEKSFNPLKFVVRNRSDKLRSELFTPLSERAALNFFDYLNRAFNEANDSVKPVLQFPKELLRMVACYVVAIEVKTVGEQRMQQPTNRERAKKAMKNFVLLKP